MDVGAINQLIAATPTSSISRVRRAPIEGVARQPGQDGQGSRDDEGAIVRISKEGAAASRALTETSASDSAESRREAQKIEAEIRELKARDREVKAHEQAHAAAAGSHALGGPKYEYTTGPDGRQYAIGGEVAIDTSPVAGDPEATLRKMEQVRAAALAPAEPSAQDRKVAAEASAEAAKARAEIREQKSEERETFASRVEGHYRGRGGGLASGSLLDLQA